MISAWEQAAQHFIAGRFEEARNILLAMLASSPRSAEAHLALARIDIQTAHVRSAAHHALAAATAAGPDARLLCDIAASLLTVAEVPAARDALRNAASTAPAEASLQQYLAMQFQNLGDHDAALEWMERARTLGSNDPASRFRLAVQLTFHDRIDEAERELERCIGAQPPLGRAMAQLSQLRTQTSGRNHLERLANQIAAVAVGSEDHAALEFARYKEFEDLGRYEDAWRSLELANRTMHTLLRHDSASERRTFEALRRHVATSVPARVERRPDGPVPIFIVGLPRSGTTLLDRLLGNHTDVRSAGELGTFRRCLEQSVDRFTGAMLDEQCVARLSRVDYVELGDKYLANTGWRAGDRRFFVDKMPRNWLLVPLIQAALPEARILHMTREPLGVAFSNYRSYFGPDYPYCYDPEALAGHYSLYRRLMRQWHASMPGKLLDVSYRGLVTDVEAEMRKVLRFCGLAWQPACLDPSRNKTPVATPSALQVRGAITAGMSMRWQHYEPYLTRLRQAMAAVTEIDEQAAIASTRSSC